MSPLGKPDPNTGEVVAAGRHYSGGHGSLGTVGVWTCPGCGQKNTTDFLQGCPTCGAGKPGEVKPQPAAPVRPPVKPGHSRPAAPAAPPASLHAPTATSQRGVPEGVVRVVRLVEYLIAPGKLQAGNLTLRNSLVGSLLFDWGQLTGTIVDELSARQEEILKLAKLQPGVWLGKRDEDEDAMALTRPPAPRPMTRTPAAAPVAPPPAAPEIPIRGPKTLADMQAQAVQDAASLLQPAEPLPAVVPDVGIAVTAEIQAMAQEFAETYGYRFCNTLALALSGIAEELRGNMEPRKFLDPDECLAFAQALMNAIPNEWDGDPEEESTQGPHAYVSTGEDPISHG